MTRRLIRVILVVTVVTLVGTITGAPERVGALCYGSGCNGIDPNAAGCGADAYTVTYTYSSGLYAQLRYSSACNANWARSYSPGGHHFQAYLYSPGLGVESLVEGNAYDSYHSNMGDGSLYQCAGGAMGPLFQPFNVWINNACG